MGQQSDHKAAHKAWQLTQYGDYIVNTEAEILAQWLPRLFGYRMVLLGTRLQPLELSLRQSPIRQRVGGDHAAVRCGLHSDILTRMSALPLKSDSIDLAVLFHALDTAEDPRRLIREVERILIPEGRVIIFGFNPYSLVGVWRLLGRSRSAQEMGSHIQVGSRQLKEWLSLLGIEFEQQQYFAFRPPLRSQSALERLAFLESTGQRMWSASGAVYALQAVKRVSTLTPFRPSFQLFRRRYPANGVAAPTTRGMHDDS
jgi:SAM-dependent methyltransferase